MIKEGIEKVLEIAEAKIHDVNGKPFSDKKLLPVLRQEPKEVCCTTLSSLVAIAESEPDLSPFVFHLLNPWEVFLLTDLKGDHLQRYRLASARLPFAPFQFGEWFEIEQFIISVRSLFVQDTSTETILKRVGNLTDEDIRTLEDDGVSQQATVRAGIARVTSAVLPGIIVLRPFRTFAEVAQPASNFLFRLRSGRGQMQAALFEADGGAWKIEAIANIGDWIRSSAGPKIKDRFIIA